MRGNKTNIKKTIKKRIELHSKNNAIFKNIQKTVLKISPIEFELSNNHNLDVINVESNIINNFKLSEDKYDICIIITTYNRELLLKRLLIDIENNIKNWKILVLVFDDASDCNNKLDVFNVKHIKYPKNHGKMNYWKLISDTMSMIKQVKSKYFIYLPDDVTLIDDFFTKAINQYNDIISSNKICLNLLIVKQLINKTNWTDFKPIDYGAYYKTQWCDLCFISERKFFEELKYKINETQVKRNSIHQSSGVGSDISIRLNKLGFEMYHVKNTLVFHDDHDSVMNYEERKKNKLTT